MQILFEIRNANTLFGNHCLRVRHRLEHVVLVVVLVHELVPVRVRVLLVLLIVPKIMSLNVSHKTVMIWTVPRRLVGFNFEPPTIVYGP